MTTEQFDASNAAVLIAGVKFRLRMTPSGAVVTCTRCGEETEVPALLEDGDWTVYPQAAYEGHVAEKHGPQVGDWADHKNGQLDPRRVARVGRGMIWLEVAGAVIGPFPADGYEYTRGT